MRLRATCYTGTGTQAGLSERQSVLIAGHQHVDELSVVRIFYVLARSGKYTYTTNYIKRMPSYS
jgi:hypothetical protein